MSPRKFDKSSGALQLALLAIVHALVFCTPLGIASAHADVVGITEAELVNALAQKGLKYRLGNDSFREPMIESYSGSVRFYVQFYDCDQSRRCKNIQFRSGYAVRGTLALSKVNDWSSRWRFGRLYLDPEGDAILDMDVEMSRGSSDAMVSANLNRWLEVMREAEGFIGWRRE